MIRPDIQYFDSDGTWVKPDGAVRADVVLQAAGGGGAVALTGTIVHPYPGLAGETGEIMVRSIPARDLPSEVHVEIGKGGRPGGRDGYVLVVTHLADEEGGQR